MAIKKVGIAFDKASVRSFDADGRMHVSKTRISKANVCPYMGSEIPDPDNKLGLDPNKVYRLYRDPAELAKGASTFNNIQLLHKHIAVSADAPQKDSVAGSIGSDVVFEAPYLCASLCIWTSEAIELVEREELDELSASYRYIPVMTPGVSPDGESYDGRMTEIQGNHLALVEVGRAGPDVIVADSNPFVKPLKESTVKITKLGIALMASLAALSPKIAQDSALPKLLGGADKKTFDKPDVLAKLIAMDADIDPEQAGDIIDAVSGVQESPEPLQPGEPVEDNAGSLSEFLKSKGLCDEDIATACAMQPAPANDEEATMKPEDVSAKVDEGVKTAMDAMRAEFRALETAKTAVRSTVGDVLGMDSAEQVYRFALDHLKVAHKDMPAAGLPTLFAVAGAKPAPSRASVAMDSAALAEQFPGLARF